MNIRSFNKKYNCRRLPSVFPAVENVTFEEFNLLVYQKELYLII